MKKILFALLILSACNFKKVSKVTIINNNNYSVQVALFANNVNYKSGQIAAKQKSEGQLDFTNLNQHDGSYLIVVKHSNDGSVDSFTHGYFTSGALANYTNLEITDHQVKVQITE